MRITAAQCLAFRGTTTISHFRGHRIGLHHTWPSNLTTAINDAKVISITTKKDTPEYNSSVYIGWLVNVSLDMLLKNVRIRDDKYLTLWRPLLPYGYSYEASCARLG